jgi:hypothetical protein
LSSKDFLIDEFIIGLNNIKATKDASFKLSVKKTDLFSCN